MRTVTIITTAALLFAPDTSLAFSEHVIGDRGINTRMYGWFCVRRNDAETISLRLHGGIPAKAAASAFGRCAHEARDAYSVHRLPHGVLAVFTRQDRYGLGPSYLVPTLVFHPRQQEARAK